MEPTASSRCLETTLRCPEPGADRQVGAGQVDAAAPCVSLGPVSRLARPACAASRQEPNSPSRGGVADGQAAGLLFALAIFNHAHDARIPAHLDLHAEQVRWHLIEGFADLM